MDIREAKVSTVNHILPIIRETIKKERTLNGLKEKLKQQKKLYDQLNKETDSLESTLKVMDIDETIKQKLEETRKQKEETKSQIVVLIKNYESQIEELGTQIKFENALHSAIGNAITINLPSNCILCGAYPITELQEEFIEEYVYLINCSSELDMNKFLFVKDYFIECELSEKYVGKAGVSMDIVLKRAIELARKLK